MSFAAPPAPIASALPVELAGLHQAYLNGSLTPLVVVDHFLQNGTPAGYDALWISQHSPQWLRSRAQRLMQYAAQHGLNKALQDLPLFGALVAVKDNIDVVGLPTTAACPAYAYTPTQSAWVVQKLEAAGAIIVGKTNLDQFATGLVGTRSPYGEVPNSFQPDYMSGGSSSGSAVAVALGLVHAALGTDTAGSGRVPAAHNNIVGLKPSKGLLSIAGVVPACKSLDCVSIFTHTVADAGRLLMVMQGFNPADAFSRGLKLCTTSLPAQFTFAIPRADQLTFYGDDAAHQQFERDIALLQALGGQPVEIDYAPLAAVADLLYNGPFVAERLEATAHLLETDPQAIHPVVKSIVEKGTSFTAQAVFQAQATVKLGQHYVNNLLRQAALLLVPTAPTIYTRQQIAEQPVVRNQHMGTYTNFVNLLDLAALAIPSGLRDNGLPIGMTLIGPCGSDLQLAELGQRLQQARQLPMGATGLPLPELSTTTPWLPVCLPESDTVGQAERDTVRIAVVGAHLSGMPLNSQLTERGAVCLAVSQTAPDYVLYALPHTTPPKPGLLRIGAGEGTAITVEIWAMPLEHYGSFVALVPSPLAIGTLILADGSQVQGFLCEPQALAGAQDISHWGGWRAYLNSLTVS